MKRILKFLGIILLLAGFVFFSELLAAKLIQIYGQIKNQRFDIKYQLLLGQVIRGILIIPIIYKRSRKTPYIKVSIKKDFWKMIVIGFGVFSLGNIIVSILLYSLKDLPSITRTLETLDEVSNLSSGFFLTFIVIVILAPITEELIFRGILFEEINRLFDYKFAIFSTALLFGIYHFNILQGVNTFAMAIILAIVYYYRKNILDSILIHMVNNFLALILTINQNLSILIFMMGFASIFLGFTIIKKIIKSSN